MLFEAPKNRKLHFQGNLIFLVQKMEKKKEMR